MNVKVGQWARDDNMIFEITKEITVKFIEYDIKNGTNDLKVANTPQELIQVGDLIILKGYCDEPLLVSYIDKQGHQRATVRTSSGSESIDLLKYYDFITKILTPNGKDYICQWEKTDE